MLSNVSFEKVVEAVLKRPYLEGTLLAPVQTKWQPAMFFAKPFHKFEDNNKTHVHVEQ